MDTTTAEPPAPRMETRDQQPGPARMERLATFRPASFNAEARTVEVVFTTGADVERRDFWTGSRWVERLKVSPEAIDLARLNAGAPVLNTHSSWDLGDVIGVVERAWIEGTEGRALLRLSDRQDLQPIIRDIQAGIIRNISVGYSVEQWKVTEATRSSGEIREAVRWTPAEISFVPVPADAGAQVRSGARPTRGQPAPHYPEVRMDNPNPGAQDAPALHTPEQIRAETERQVREAREAELARAREIRSAATSLGLADDGEAFVADGSSVVDAQRKLIAKLAERRGNAEVKPAAVTIQRDEGDTLRQAIQGALEARLSGKPHEGPAAQFRAASLVEMGTALLRQRGIDVQGLSRADIARSMLGLPIMGRNMMTSSDFTALLANVQSKRLMSAYDTLPRTFLQWCARRELPDFKTASIIDMGAGPSMLTLAEGGTITQGVLSDAGETYNLVRYARNVALSYVAIVNDDLGGLDRLPQAFATAVANLENATAYGVLETNANMADSNALFSAAHGNTAAGSMDVAGVTAARSQILRQTDPNGQRIMVMPSIIIVPTELAGTARALFSANIYPAGVGTTAVNPWQGQFELVETPFLSDTNDYFVTVKAGSGYEPVEVAYEMGNSSPQLTSYVKADVDGVEFSCRHSFAAKAATWRTIARVTA